MADPAPMAPPAPQQAPMPPPAYGYAPPAAGAPARPRTSGMAVASLVCGIIALCLSWILFVNFAAAVAGVLALVFGLVANGQVKNGAGAVGGKGLAVAGIVLGVVALVIVLLYYTVLAAMFRTILRNARTGRGAVYLAAFL